MSEDEAQIRTLVEQLAAAVHRGDMEGCSLPDHHLRLDLGLCKEQGRWVVAHEHHSFADVSGDPAAAEQEKSAVHQRP